MSTRLDYLVRKLGDLDDAIAREKTEYDKARDRYDKMRSRDILNELFDQLKGYRTEHDQLRRSNSAQATHYEIEEPDGKSYVVRGGAVVRDFDPARDKVRKAE
ncbi:hypothetical protein N8I77_006724 [Diaporthe amygdali]|uniref:Uncharacterized protein n=1 Tax=Phomopsis amygdali TaxID=1214568 RepID=A0AAD9SHZ0_PHOAM|nr:hypothetical protein N8I77_006724 [Diaporthe amygdali]